MLQEYYNERRGKRRVPGGYLSVAWGTQGTTRKLASTRQKRKEVN